MSEELTKVKHAEKADELVNYKQITLDGDVTGEIEAKQDGTQGFNGSEDVKITTTITGGDISKTTIEITELSGVDEEEIQSKEITGKLLYKIKNKFEEIEKGLENKLGKIDAATSAEKLSKGKNISLEGNVKGTVVFDGSKDVNIETEIIGGDIKDTVVSFTESSIREEIQSGERTSIIVGKIKKNFNDVDLHMKNKSNPHELSKEQLGLGNVENTSDLEKTISNATQSALDNKLGKNDKAKDSEKFDGKESSYYAPIANPIFKEDVEVQGVLKTQQTQLLPLDSIKRTSINNDITYVHICTLPFNSNGSIYLYGYGGYIDETIEIKILGGNTISNKLEVKASKHLKEYGITKVYLYAKTKYFGSDMDIYVQFKQQEKNTNNIYLLYGDMIYHNSIVNKLSFVEALPTDKVLLDKIIISSEKGIYKNIEQTSLTPLIDDKSNKIATTEFVHDNINNSLLKTELWHIPSEDDFKSINELSVWGSHNNINGRFFSDLVQDRNSNGVISGKAIFLPAAGERFHDNGKLENKNLYGYYWVHNKKDNVQAYHYSFSNNINPFIGCVNKCYGLSLRLVKYSPSVDSVCVGGRYWAKTNLDGAGYFCVNPQDYGGLFQWDASVGFDNSTERMILGWNKNCSKNLEWTNLPVAISGISNNTISQYLYEPNNGSEALRLVEKKQYLNRILENGSSQCFNSAGSAIIFCNNTLLASFMLYVTELDTNNYLIATGIKEKNKPPIITMIKNNRLTLGPNNFWGTQRIDGAINNNNIRMNCVWNEILTTP